MRKKIYSILLSSALCLSMMVAMPNVAMADETAETTDAVESTETEEETPSYETYIQLQSLVDDTSSIIYTGNKEKIKTKGFSYDAKKNILTINNVDLTYQALYIDDMGRDFKLEIHGTNRIGAITVSGSKYPATLNLLGAGKLVVNEKKLNSTPICVVSSAMSRFLCGENVSLSVYGDPDGALISASGTVPNKAISFSNKKASVGEVISDAEVNPDDEKTIYNYRISGPSLIVKGKQHTHEWQLVKVKNKASFEKNGQAEYSCDHCGKSKTMAIPRLNYAVLEVYGFKYNGKPKKPGVIVHDIKDNILTKDNYTVSYKNNVNKGWATATIKFKGMYTGKVEKRFVIG